MGGRKVIESAESAVRLCRLHLQQLGRKSAVKWSTPLATAEPLGVSRFLFSCTTSETSWSRSGTKQVSVNIENKLNRNSCDKYAKKTKKCTQPNMRAGMKRAIDFCTREPREEPFSSCQKFYSILNFFNFESRPHASNTRLQTTTVTRLSLPTVQNQFSCTWSKPKSCLAHF